MPITTFLQGLRAEHPNWKVRVAHGAARGADTAADHAARSLGLEVEAYPAEWDRYGKRAGFLRNAQMVSEFKPHIVLACSEHPITKGTQHTVNLAKQANLTLYVISHG